jgi:predicted DNA binding CopG/RHH family protein
MSKEPKALKIGPRPERKAPASVEEFVSGKPTNKRLTIDMPEELHTRVKFGAVREGLHIADVVRELLDKRFPPL